MDANGGQAMMDAIARLAEVNNQFYPGSALSFSMGAATSQPGERLEAVVKRADLAMFEQKRAHYARDMDELLRATSGRLNRSAVDRTVTRRAPGRPLIFSLSARDRAQVDSYCP
jgi:GGDEF domain-containing protein